VKRKILPALSNKEVTGARGTNTTLGAIRGKYIKWDALENPPLLGLQSSLILTGWEVGGGGVGG